MSNSGLRQSSYGKGADIWPPTKEGTVQLIDSFPNAKIPVQVSSVLRQQQPIFELDSSSDSSIANTRKRQKKKWRWLLPRAIDRILRRAAIREEQTTTPSLNLAPAVLALSLFLFVQPIDVLLVTFLSGYLFLLTQLAWSTNQGVPALPSPSPQGHVPTFVSNPLGYNVANLVHYNRWLKVSVFTGLVAPVAWILQGGVTSLVRN